MPGPDLPPAKECEWLETDGLGGFASGTVGGWRTRRYHALLMPALTPPTGRVSLVAGLDAEVQLLGGGVAISTQRYRPGVMHPDGHARLVAFRGEPWPQWRHEIAAGVFVEHELFLAHGTGEAVLSWRLVGGPLSAILRVRPFLSCRDYHALGRERPVSADFIGEAPGSVRWGPFPGMPHVVALHNGMHSPGPVWYRDFLLDAETQRGLDDVEDLLMPGTFSFDLARGEAVLVLRAGGSAGVEESAAALAAALASRESSRRAAFPSPLHGRADQFIVQRGRGLSIIAGYPWFTDWGRDTFISMRGLCLATGRVDDARRILLEWAGTVSEGMLPNRFPDSGGTPEYNSVDASLWFIVAVHELFEHVGSRMKVSERNTLKEACSAIIAGYRRGTRHRIGMDRDGLVFAGEPGVQLTWMDAKVGDWVVTPRVGKPVEIQALWINALRIAGAWDPELRKLATRAAQSLRSRYWNEQGGWLHDVVDVDGVSGRCDASIRPNQVFAFGGLPFTAWTGEGSVQALEVVERELVTPMGLRTLAPGDRAYRPRHEGSMRDRDGAYHQGTVWPWLMGAFVDAWLRAHGNTASLRERARSRFLAPLEAHLGVAGLGHVSEIADGDPPHTPKGCPFQAWSLGELIRMRAMLGDGGGLASSGNS